MIDYIPQKRVFTFPNPPELDRLMSFKSTFPARVFNGVNWEVTITRKTAPAVWVWVREHAEEITPRAMEELSRIEAPDQFLEIPTLQAELKPWQRAGVVWILEYQRVILADKPGLGKTIQTLAAMEAGNYYPAFIICPAGLRLNWAVECSRFLPHRKVEILYNASSGNHTAEIFLLSYEALETWIDGIKTVGPEVIVLDEAHYIKNYMTGRAKLAREVGKYSARKIALTGTPITGQPSDLMQLLIFTGTLNRFGGFWKFGERYCDAKEVTLPDGRSRWDFSGAINLEELRDRLRDENVFLSRGTDLLDLPGKNTEVFTVDPDPEFYLDYVAAEEDFIEYLRANDLKVPGKKALAIVKLSGLRTLASRCKYAAAIQWVENWLLETDQNDRLIVFTWYRETAEIFDRFGPVLTGDIDSQERFEAIQSWRAGTGRVLTLTMGAGGTGLNLFEANYGLFVEMDWLPLTMEQAEGRLYRMGQTKPVFFTYLLAGLSIEIKMLAAVNRKVDVIEAVIDSYGKDISE